ncbi:MAG TPA: acyl-CoA synthetase [Acidimicrobiia bacterium]|nr:acyl-CoA synthetase [Acidimicrobiia bacterium]
MTDWSFARIWSQIADAVPDREAIVCGDRRLTYGEFDTRATRLAEVFAGAGLRPGDSVALCLVNSPEYLEGFFAAQKAGCSPVNVNYRYVDAELAYLLADSGARAVVFHDEFAPTVEEAVKGLDDPPPLLLQVPHDGDGTLATGALEYEGALVDAPTAPVRHEPSGDDVILLYTGGTTGMPKGVMWRSDDLYVSLWQVGRGTPEPVNPVPGAHQGKRAVTTLPACPLMHGTGLFFALTTLSGGGTVVLVDRPRLDADLVWETVERERVGNVVIVGDAFARPLLASLDANPDRWDLSSLKAMCSSGVMWSPETKRGLLEHLPGVLLVDSMGASEGLMARSTAQAGDAEYHAGRFEQNERVSVITDDGRHVEAGSGEVGMLAVGGRIPLGYRNDPVKTAATFREVDGTRWSIPGDYATVEADGSIRLLGRGSQCINTGGEKVYPEEVDEVVKLHPAVFDCVTVGVPHERWGEMVVAVVQFRPGREADPADLRRHCHDHLAGYKCPKEFVVLDTLARSPSGKADYKLLRRKAARAVGVEVD